MPTATPCGESSLPETEFRPDPRRVPGPRPDRDPDPLLRAVPSSRRSTDKRTDSGLEGVLREIFPIESYDKTLTLEYIRYELGKPRYDPDECRQLRLTYGRPFRVWLRLNKERAASRKRSTSATCRS